MSSNRLILQTALRRQLQSVRFIVILFNGHWPPKAKQLEERRIPITRECPKPFRVHYHPSKRRDDEIGKVLNSVSETHLNSFIQAYLKLVIILLLNNTIESR